jgi:uncharacterized membrane protein
VRAGRSATERGIARTRQHGAGAVSLLLLLLGLVAMLGLVEVGYLYWTKRDLQRVADLAALAGAQRLDLCSADGADNSAARANATQDNGFDGTLVLACGHWQPAASGDGFSAVGADAPLNAVRATATRTAVPIFGRLPSMPTVSAAAVARHSAPAAAFSAGSRLLDIDGDAPLQQVLALLGVDLSGTQVASYQGLANVEVTPRGLLEALGIPVATDLDVGEFNALLLANSVSVGQLLDVMASLASTQGVANASVTALSSAAATLGIRDVAVQLGSNDTSSGLFASVVGGDGSADSALDVQVDALNLIGAAISVATGKHAVTVPQVNLLGLVQGQAALVEPASIGIGPVGTTAYNAQVRLKLDIDSDQLLLAGSLFRLLGTRIHLPLYIDVVDGFAELTAIDCDSRPRTASFDVTSNIANICIGTPVGDWASLRSMCTGAGNLADAQLVKLFGANVLTTHVAVPALQATDSIVVPVGGTGTVAPNQLEVGTTVSALTDALFSALDALLNPAGASSTDAAAASSLATQYLEATKSSNGRYNADAVVAALQSGTSDLGALGTWTTTIPQCSLILCWTTQGDVWTGFKYSVQGTNSLLGAVLGSVLGITACNGLLSSLLNYNGCVRDNLAKYLLTKPDGLGSTNYDPQTASGSCSTVLCAMLRPVINATLRPVLNAVGSLLATTLDDVFGLQLGRTDVHVDAIQCQSAQLVH